MAGLTRFTGSVLPFGVNSTLANRTIFGGLTQSDAIDDNLNANFLLGWEIVGLNDAPTKQDFNAQGYTLGYLSAYLYQQGIAEYSSTQVYQLNSVVMASNGKLYKSLSADNVGNDPITDGVNWTDMLGTFVEKTSDTGSVKVVTGTTAQRDGTAQNGYLRYNTDLNEFEGYKNGSWQGVGGGQMLGQATVKAISYNAQSIAENITITTGLNASSVGDITIETGFTVTVEAGAVWKIL